MLSFAFKTLKIWSISFLLVTILTEIAGYFLDEIKSLGVPISLTGTLIFSLIISTIKSK